MLNLESKELSVELNRGYSLVAYRLNTTPKRSEMEYGGALVHVQQPRLELVAVSGDARKQLMQSVRIYLADKLQCSLNRTIIFL